VALDAKTGRMLGRRSTCLTNGDGPGGYSGGAVWQPPAIDAKRGTLFASTGNNYTAPADVELASKQLLRRTARLLTISLTLRWRWT